MSEQHYGLCPFCGTDITRAAGTPGRAPVTCGATKCVAARKAAKQKSWRAGRTHVTEPMGGFGSTGDFAPGQVDETHTDQNRQMDGFQILNGFDFFKSSLNDAGETGPAGGEGPLAATVWCVGARELAFRRAGGDHRPWRSVEVKPALPKSQGSESPIALPADVDAAVWQQLFEESRMLNPKNLAVVVAGIHPTTGVVEDISLNVVAATVTDDGRPDRVWAEVSDGEAMDITDKAWRWLLVDLTMPEDELLAVLTRWHYQIQVEADEARGQSVSWLEELGLAV